MVFKFVFFLFYSFWKTDMKRNTKILLLLSSIVCIALGISSADYSYNKQNICIGDVCSVETCDVTEYDPTEVIKIDTHTHTEMHDALLDYLRDQGQDNFVEYLLS